MTTIDVHHHWVPPVYIESLGREFARDPGALNPAARAYGTIASLCSVDARFDDMDRSGVDIAVLSLPTPGVQFGSLDDSIELASLVNDAMISAVRDHPRRLRALVALPFPDGDAAWAELDRVGDSDQIRGVGVMTNAQSWAIDDPSFERAYARAAELSLPLVLHPQLEQLDQAYADHLLFASFAPVISSSLGMLRLVLSGVLDRVPELEVIVPHLGGTVLYLAQRVMDQSGNGDATHDLLHYCRTRLFFDTCSYHHPALRCAVDTVGAQRLLLGTDFPFRGSLKRAVDDIATFPFTDAEEMAILGETAAKWFATRS